MMDFAAARRTMIENQLRTYDVLDYNTLDAMGAVPREAFVPDEVSAMAYLDRQLSLGQGRALMTPMVFGRLLQALDVQKTDQVLDVAGGSGYSAAIFARLCHKVVALEEDDKMAADAAANVKKLGIENVAVECGAIRKGSSKNTQFDVIFINGAIEAEPKELLAQLADGGRLGVVLGFGRSGRAVVYRRNAGNITASRIFDASAIPLSAFAKPPEFSF